MANLRVCESGISPAALNAELQTIQKKQEEPSYWENAAASAAETRRAAQIQKKLDRLAQYVSGGETVTEYIELAESSGDTELLTEIETELARLEKETDALFLETLLKGKYDSLNAIISIQAGAGGTEAQDWADMLYRMYTRYGEREGYKLAVLDYQEGGTAGIKSVSFSLTGDNAYGFLKAEKGVHRLVRISPFDADKARHTSFASVEVMPEIQDTAEIEIRSEDLRVDTLKSSGAGGQHINKTESAIRITHIPTGIVVGCQTERSQIQNRETAMSMLRARLAEKKEREQAEEHKGIQGEMKKIEWGSQIRSYVFCPYTLVKDHRTGSETPDVYGVMDGDISSFIYDYLKKSQAL
ncbi:MAG: peptide chain release factor 2 [Christensenellaceae bacterium]|nr:peptide chain release factor 2 [Christensenellaceae bacterium]